MSAFDNGLHHQDSPGFVEFPAYDVDIVSAELPCGVAWLVNCLIELDVPISKPWNAHVPDEWERLDDHCYRYARADEPWKRTLPGLVRDRIFRFRPGPVPRVSHAWPRFHPASRKTILFVRDPRDALCSAWQRARQGRTIGLEVGFVEWVRAPFHHYPLSVAEYLLLFLRVWREAIRDREALVLRYEDYRRAAVPTLRRALAFLRIDSEEAALLRTAERSDFAVLRDMESRQLARGDIQFAHNRAGRAFEYVDTFDAPMHAALGPRFADIYAWLGYERDRSGLVAQERRTGHDVGSILRAMRADQLPTPAREWLQAAVAQCTHDFAFAFA